MSYVICNNLEDSISWIKEQASSIGLEYNAVEFPPPGEFAIWLTWRGRDPSLPSILLNSHIDVVPVDEVNVFHHVDANLGQHVFE